MDLKSGYPYWAINSGLMQAFPVLASDARCDVAVIGGGITGALIADELARSGQDVVLLEQRDIGWGSTAASTALLQYEIDTHMIDLARTYDEDTAVLAYRACVDAIAMLRSLAGRVRDVGFAPMQSLYYASKRRHRHVLHEEFVLRRRHGIDVQWLESDALQARFGIDAPGAILSATAAAMDPYRMAWRLCGRLQRRGARIHDRTCVDHIDTTSRGVHLRTTSGISVRAGHVVLAMGYANQQWLRKRVARNRSSYAFISDPVDGDALGVLRDTMMWESARPYLYLRTTTDGRVLAGGEDDAVDIPAKRDRRVEKKARVLVDKVGQLLPGLDLQPAFSWAGTFAETADGLPFFGPHPQWGPRVHFAMAYGGNGIVYSMLGAGLLRALIERRRHPLSSLFAFKRVGIG